VKKLNKQNDNETDDKIKLFTGKGAIDLRPKSAIIVSQQPSTSKALFPYDNDIVKTDENDIYGNLRIEKNIFFLKGKKN
jgi:hypothetical protein